MAHCDRLVTKRGEWTKPRLRAGGVVMPRKRPGRSRVRLRLKTMRVAGLPNRKAALINHG